MTEYNKAEADVEFGGMDAAVGGGRSWRKFKTFFKRMFTGAAKSEMAQAALNAYAPGTGDAVRSAVQLIEAGKSNDPTVAAQAVAQIQSIADAAKAGDTAKTGAHELLTTLNEAHAEARAELPLAAALAEVGKKVYVVRLPDGTTKKFKSKKALEEWRKQQVRRRPAGQQPQRGQQRPAGQRPVTQQNVAQAMARVPPQRRQQFAQTVQQMQLQGYAPVAPVGQPGYPYGMQQGQPFGYGLPGMMQDPYGGAYASESYVDQGEYYGDEELAAAFAEDESFPDDGLQGENAIAYQG